MRVLLTTSPSSATAGSPWTWNPSSPPSRCNRATSPLRLLPNTNELPTLMLWSGANAATSSRTKVSAGRALNSRVNGISRTAAGGAQRLQGPELLSAGIDERRHPVGRDNAVGMPIESHHHAESLVLSRVRDRLPDDLLVALMHAVEHADGQRHPAPLRAELVGAVERLHRELLGAGQLKERHHVLGQLGDRPLQDVFELGGVIDENLPESSRRNVRRCAPQPSRCPRSCTSERT